jgi:hypothetical protein
MKYRTMYEIREYTSKSAYSKLLSSKLKTRDRAIKIISRLTWRNNRDIVMSPVQVSVGA